MRLKTIIWILAIILAFFAGVIIYKNMENNSEEIAINETTQNSIEISEENKENPVTDECIEEWNDYNNYMGEKIEEASTNVAEGDTHYLLKDINGFIEVYYLDENNKEYLYKKTNISTDYLTEEDVEDLKVGIEVVGSEALNKMLEDFE